jgi:NTP pyrophosphatase (non-canonical NTP hydrolase)
MINKLAQQVHENAKSKGFFDEPKNIGEMLCLIHSEVSEALEADRKGMYTNISDIKLKGLADKNFGATFYEEPVFKDFFSVCIKNTFEDELADIVIRVMDLAAFKGIDLENHIKAKMRYNSLRPHKHGKKY